MQLIDCDANATYAPSTAIQQLVTSFLPQLGNPSSLHRVGQRARAVVEEARDSIRRLVGASRSDTVLFTSGATEGNNTIIASVSLTGGQMLSSSIEHPCVLEPLKRVQDRGVRVVLVSPEPSGRIDPAAVLQAMTGETGLVSIMAANNETGVINPIDEIAQRVRKCNPRTVIHTDAAQLVGKAPCDFHELGVDVMTISGHKIGALTGIGALIIRDGVTVNPAIVGGAQEGKLRGGTENVLGIASFAAAAEEVLHSLSARIESMQRARDVVESAIVAGIQGVQINGREIARLPNTMSVYIPGVRADDLVVALDLEGLLISSGSACSAGKPEPSHVLLAMGQPEERVRSTVRFSLRHDYAPGIDDAIATTLERVVKRMRSA